MNEASCLRVMVKNESVHATSGLDYFNALLSGSEKPLLLFFGSLLNSKLNSYLFTSKIAKGQAPSYLKSTVLSYHPNRCFTHTLQDHLRFQASGARTWRSSPHSPTPSLGSQFNMVSIPSDDLEPVTLICCYRLSLLSRRAVHRVHMPLLHLVINLCHLFPVQLKHLSLQPAVSSPLTVIVKVSSSHRSSDIKQVQNSQDIFSESGFPKAKFVNSAKIFTTVWLEIH